MPHDTNPAPEDAPVALTPGERLRAAREARGESLKDIAARTHQSIDTLRALEEMETGRLSPTVIRMHAARYANALALPEQELADAYAESRVMMNVANVKQDPKPDFGAGRKLIIGGVALTALALGAVAVFSMMSSKNGDIDTVPVSTRVMPQNATASNYGGQALEAPSKTEIALRAKRAGWLEVRASDGTIFRSRQMAAGEVYFPRMDAGWTLTARDGSSFEVLINDKPVMPFGEEAGVPLYSVSVDSVSERAQALLQQQIAKAEKENAAKSR